jgi:hypothetical protein
MSEGEKKDILSAIFEDLDEVTEGREALLNTWEGRDEELEENGETFAA